MVGETVILYLNDKKVCRYFGAHPERGRPLPGNRRKRVTVGVKWSLPKKDYLPDDDVLVRPTVALKCLGKGKWEILVEATYRDRAIDWLVDNCM